MALNDMYELVDRQVLGTSVINNVYHLVRDNAGIVAATIAEAYEDRIIAPLLPLQDGALSHISIDVRNLGDPTDFAVRVPSPAVGTRVGEPFASFVAAAIQFNRTRTDIKNGQKRWVAGVEADADGNNWLAAFVTSLQTLRDPILATWFTDALPAAPVADYVVIQRVCTVQPPPTPCPSYRLPNATDPLVFYQPTSAIIRGVVRSQVSRKRVNP